MMMPLGKPFALSLSKGLFSYSQGGFDKLSPNGIAK